MALPDVAAAVGVAEVRTLEPVAPVRTALPKPEEQPTLRVDETAHFLGISEDSVRRAIKAGEIPALSVGRRVLVPTAALRRLLAVDPA